MTIIKRQTILGTIWAYLGVFVGTITQAFLIPKYLTTEENGLLAMLMSWMYILVFVANLGFTSAGTKFFDRFRNEERQHSGFLNLGIRFIFLGMILISLFLFLFENQIIESNIGDTSLFKRFYFLIIPITFSTALFNLFDNYAKGLYDTLTGNFLSQFLQRFLVLLSVLAYALDLISFKLFIGLWAAGISFPTLLMIIHAARLQGFSLRKDHLLRRENLKKPFFTFAGFSILTGLSNIIITKLDTLMVYDYLGLSNTGIYNTCLFFGSVMTISYNVNLKASTAIVLDAMARKEFDKIRQIFKKSSVTQTLFGTLLLALVWINLDELFSFVKPEYALGKQVIIIIGLAKLYDLACGVNTLILSFSEYYKYDSVLVISFIGLLFILNKLLIPPFGLNGAAFAAFLATIYYNTTRNFLIWKFFRMHPYSWNLLFIILGGAVLVYLGSRLPASDASPLLALMSVSYKSVLITLLFVLFIYFSKFSEDVNQLINRIFRVFSK